MNFEYFSPTKIIFGLEKEKEVGQIIKEYGYKKILLHYGQSSIKKIGLYDTIVKSLKEAEIAFVEVSGVEANPKIELVRETVKLCQQEKIDFILAVGGGSVIDSAKAIACGTKVNFDPWLFSNHTKTPIEVLPIGVILTISAAGSELSNSCVITNPEIEIKNGFNSDLMRPLFVIENPQLTYSVSKYQTACGVVDILMHTLERYLTDEVCHPLAEKIAEGLMKEVLRIGKRSVDNPTDLEARSTLMLASSFSHNGLTGMGGKMYFTVHKLEHQLSGKYDSVAHGAGLAIIFPAWANYVWKNLKHQFAKLAYNVFDIDERLQEEEAIILSIKNIKKYFADLGMPVSLEELALPEIDIEKMANSITNNDKNKVPGFKELSKEDVINIFNSCYKNTNN